MSTSGISNLLRACEAIGTHDPAYYAKMIHDIPEAITVERIDYILARCEGKVVLDIGASGPMHEEIVRVAKQVYAIDLHAPEKPGYFSVDLDNATELPAVPADIIVCGEVIEHLGNPLNFLKLLRKTYATPVIVTTPNAFGATGTWYVKNKAQENVNLEHVAYYSYWTLYRLLTKAGYVISEFCWYGGPPRLSEGMIALVRGDTHGNL